MTPQDKRLSIQVKSKMTKILELNIAPVLIVLNSIKITSAMNKNKIQQRKNIFSYTHIWVKYKFWKRSLYYPI